MNRLETLGRRTSDHLSEALGLTSVGGPTECPCDSLQRVVEVYRRAHGAGPAD